MTIAEEPIVPNTKVKLRQLRLLRVGSYGDAMRTSLYVGFTTQWRCTEPMPAGPDERLQIYGLR